MIVVDKYGYRFNVGIVLINEHGQVFWGRRVGQDAWQFPQGGVNEDESSEQAMYRELEEEIGLQPEDVELVSVTEGWMRYRLPKQYVRRYRKPIVIGQKQKWYLLKLASSSQKIRLDIGESPEFDSWCWVDYWRPVEEVIYFKRHIYRRVLHEFEAIVQEVSQQ